MFRSPIRLIQASLRNQSTIQERVGSHSSFRYPLLSHRPVTTSSAAVVSASDSNSSPPGKKPSKKRTSGHGQASILKWDIKTGPNATGRPTREIGKVVAYSTAEEYDLRTLPQRLKSAGYPKSTPMFNVLGEAIWFPHWPPSSSYTPGNSSIAPSTDHLTGEIFVFESGSFVSWGITQEEATIFLDKMIRPAKTSESGSGKGELEINPSRVPERETIDYLESNGGPLFEVDADQIVVGTLDQSAPSSSQQSTTTSKSNGDSSSRPRKLLNPFMPSSLTAATSTTIMNTPSDLLLLSKLAVSSALARACRLSRYEAQLDEYLSKVEHVPALLKSGNDSPLNKRDIISRYGELLELRQGLSLKEENLIDLPEWFWEDTGAEERHFKKILKEFDFERRLRVLNDKLSMAIELQGRLFEFSNSKYSHRLEWIIILLIAFEIAHAIYAADHYHD